MHQSRIHKTSGTEIRSIEGNAATVVSNRLMSEKRKPEFIFVARVRGKSKFRMELYPARLWPDRCRRRGSYYECRYRVRSKGKWWPSADQFQTVTLTEFFNVFRRSMVNARLAKVKA